MSTLPDPTDVEDTELLRSTAVAAGIIASGFFRRKLKSWTKDNASPVSEADYTVDNFLHQSLRAARPDYGWLSEEGVDDGARLSAKRCFIVDPIDGTRAFIRGDDCWSICLTVVDDGVPVAGVVYAPARDELYHACKSGGAYLNGEELPIGGETRDQPLILGPVAVHKALDAEGVTHGRGPAYPSLALRLVAVASGGLDAATARRGAQDWDIAAAMLILAESGIELADVCVGAPKFNKPTTRHGALAATAQPHLNSSLHRILRQVYGCPETEMTNELTERQDQ